MTSVLLFHAVTDRTWFDDIIAWLKRRYTVLSLDSLSGLCAGTKEAGDGCHITVDDGDRSFYDVMFPVLRKHGVPASLFVSPKICVEERNFWFQEIEGYSRSSLTHVAADVLRVPVRILEGSRPESILKTMSARQTAEVLRRYQESVDAPAKRSQNISVRELAEIAGSGLVSVGAHTMNHPILKNEDDASSKYEIEASVAELSSLIGARVTSFAYPNGIPGMDFDEREVKLLSASGIRMAFTTEARHIRQDNDTLRIPRIAVSNKESAGFLRVKLLLGSSWNTLKTIAGSGEYLERRRLSRKLRYSLDVGTGATSNRSL
jgi:peptidoglycan/xylan/chitin deacetylase (PgdA/CDA1 family)